MMNETDIEMEKIIVRGGNTHGEWFNIGRGKMLWRVGGALEEDLENEDDLKDRKWGPVDSRRKNNPGKGSANAEVVRPTCQVA